MSRKVISEYALKRVESDVVSREEFDVMDTKDIVNAQETDWYAVIEKGDDGRKEAIIYDGDRPMFCMQKASDAQTTLHLPKAPTYAATKTDADGTTTEFLITPELTPIIVNGRLGAGIRTNTVSISNDEGDRIVYCTDNGGRLRRWVAVNEKTGETTFQIRLECEGRNTRNIKTYTATVDEATEDTPLALLYLLYLELTKDEWYDSDTRVVFNGEKALESIEHLYDSRFDAKAH